MNSNKAAARNGTKADRAGSGAKADRSGSGRVRIIAGEFRGRRIEVAAQPALRPTPDRVRETLFNWLGQWLDGLACLDLFAGSGALGFEAASRRAARVVMVENDRIAFRTLEQSKELIRAKQVELVFGDAMDYLRKGADRFDVVFLDPPFRQNALAPVLERLPARLAEGGRVYIEAPSPIDLGAPWREIRRARAGQVNYQLVEWEG